MRDYLEARRNFLREALERELLTGSLNAGVNACFESCDRWAEEGQVALEWIGREGARESVTFAALREDAIRCANLLVRRGIASGDVVAGLLPRIPELLTIVLATWRIDLSAALHCLRAAGDRAAGHCRRRQPGEADRHRRR